MQLKTQTQAPAAQLDPPNSTQDNVNHCIPSAPSAVTSASSLEFILNPEKVAVTLCMVELVHNLPAATVEPAEMPEFSMNVMDIDQDSDLEIVAKEKPEVVGSKRVFSIFNKQDAADKRGTKRTIDEVEGSNETSVGKIMARNGNHVGRSRSAVWERNQNKKFIDGSLATEGREKLELKKRLEKFTAAIRILDAKAVIIDGKTVRHFKCGKEYQMKLPFNTQHFKSHVQGCNGPPKSAKFSRGGMNPISSFFLAAPKPGNQRRETEAGSSSPQEGTPCPGIDQEHHPRVKVYLGRTGALGGGASSVTYISQELFGKSYKNLSKSRKEQVHTAQRHDWLWRNDASAGRVFCVSCLKQSPSFGLTGILPCSACSGLLQHKGFKNAIKILCPPDENFKYLNQQYHNKSLALIYGRCKGLREILEDVSFSTGRFILLRLHYTKVPHAQDLSKSPMIKYVQGVVAGKHNKDDIFGLLLQAMVLKSDKDSRGVGMQNFQYAPNLVECAHIVYTHSPKAYRFLQEHLAMPDPRTLKYISLFRFQP